MVLMLITNSAINEELYFISESINTTFRNQSPTTNSLLNTPISA